MKTKLEVDTERIANYCGVSAKNSAGKISSYHLTLRKPFVEALGIAAGDTVDVAILQVNKGLPTSELKPTPEVFTAASENDVGDASVENSMQSGTANPQNTALIESQKSLSANPKKRTRGGRGKSKRGKGGKSRLRKANK